MVRWPWSRQPKDKSQLPGKVPEEVEDYYQSEKRERKGVAWLLALGTLLVTVLLAAVIFFGGRWVYRTVFDNDDSQQIATEQSDGDSAEQSPAGERESGESSDQSNGAGENNNEDQSESSNESDESDESNDGSGSTSTDTDSQNGSSDGSDTTPTTGSSGGEIPDTGPGSPALLFVTVVVTGAFAHNIVTRVKARR